MIKKLYNSSVVGRAAVLTAFMPLIMVLGFFGDLFRGRSPLASRKPHNRGTTRLYDWVDWLGGLPFEVASAQAVLGFYTQRRFRLENLGLAKGHGCNEFVFSRSGTMPPFYVREPAKAT